MRVSFHKFFKQSLDVIKDILIDKYSISEEKVNQIAIDIAKVEIAVYVLKQIKPNDTYVKSIPYLFYSPIFPSMECLDQEKKNMIGKIQVLYGSKWKVNKVVYQKIRDYQQYQSIYKEFPFHIKFITDDNFEWVKQTKGDREKLYRSEFSSPLKHKKSNVKIAKEDTLVFEGDDKKYEIIFPTYMKSQRKMILQEKTIRKRSGLTYTKSDLLDAAREMDKIRQEKGLESHNWVHRIEDIVFLDPKKSLQESNILSVKGTQQIVGPLSVGKTTLMQVMAFLNAKKGRVTTLIVKDIAEVLNLIDDFHDLNIKAVPLISIKRRKEHITQYLASIGHDDKRHLGLEIFKKHSFRYLGITCLIHGLKDEADINENPTPCFQLKEKDGINKMCPYIYNCEYYYSIRDLEDVDVIIMTIHSLMMKLPGAFFEHQITPLEFIIKNSDLIMVDEADRVQHLLDDLMIPYETIGSSQSSWLTDIQVQVESVLQRKQYFWSMRRNISWLNNLNSAISLERLIRGFLEDPETTNNIKKIIGNQMFTGWKILNTLARRLSGVTNASSNQQNNEKFLKIWKEFQDFYDSYKNDDFDENSPLIDAVDLFVDEKKQRLKVTAYVMDLKKRFEIVLDNIDEVVDGLIFALLVCGLEKRLSILTQTYAEVQSILELKGDENTYLFKGLFDDYEGILPISPTGIQFGFKYKSNDFQSGSGDLILFRYLAVGRYILTHMHKLFENVDGVPGAHTILLSGTSYAKGSDRYHIQLPISYVMVNKNQMPSEIVCKFHPVRDQNTLEWIKISGLPKEKRKEALKVLVSTLLKENYLNKILNQLEEGRKRLLVVVGSYEEANLVASWINDSNQYKENEVFGLIPEPKQNNVNRRKIYHYERQLLNAFAKSDGKILVVPLLAVERGHNILTLVEGRRVAAFGGAIYLVRPYPVPSNIAGMANWLNSLSLKDYQDPRKVKDSLYDEFSPLRKKAYLKQYEYFQTTFGYRGLSEFERTNIIMETNTSCHQLEGRLVRGGVPAIVIHCDASCAPLLADGKEETEKTSMLIGWKNHLNKLTTQDDEIEAKIVQILYGSRIKALNNLEVEY